MPDTTTTTPEATRRPSMAYAIKPMAGSLRAWGAFDGALAFCMAGDPATLAEKLTTLQQVEQEEYRLACANGDATAPHRRELHRLAATIDYARDLGRRRIECLLPAAADIVHKAMADLGPDLAGRSVVDLLCDNLTTISTREARELASTLGAITALPEPECPECGSTAIDIDPDAFMEGHKMIRIRATGTHRREAVLPGLSLDPRNLNLRELATCRGCSLEGELGEFLPEHGAD